MLADLALVLLDTANRVLTLLLVALGLAVTFGLMGIVNLAHGEFFLLGAYAHVALERLGLGFWWGLLLAPVFVGAAGWILEVVVIRRIQDRPLDSLVATWGVGLAIKQAVVLLFGPASHTVAPPFATTVAIAGTSYPVYRLFVMALALAATGLTILLLLRTPFGLMVRGTVADRGLAAATGLPVRRLDALAFAYGSALAGLAGAATAPLMSVDPQMGVGFLLPAFLSVLVAPASGAFGTVVGAAVVGGSESLAATVVSPVVAQLLVLAGAVLLLRLAAGRRYGRER
ncbi:MAG: urea ABC transporter permease subunit UrtB [Geminicoccaceae bacterium]|nr:urea ABC transporter permease subunit UrtB [Geminicoccaceae bacterium]MCS7268368.1 urea ABC transporter permease subunit UrtB [Geminicoccaceae bacterium]MCX7629431.1 urea ABC transporter permease subunit UrtB [Geminicoccaceae bacterium]MDW8124261.1 urea ABC transporter permease subunit UrtB [Geminicoccaceae bacterium]MDW8341130.1 urea ABC transporter permease subunit UrtB [Geminicoccaceae bacterium]